MQDRWIRVARVSEIPEGFGYAVKVDGLDIALFRWDQQVFALEDLCPHLGFPLSEGTAQNGEVVCAWHGWHVRLADGRCPNQKNHGRSYPCELRGEDVYVRV